MVKKFIKGILGKKDESPNAALSDKQSEVPDELPPLAEETAKNKEEIEAKEEKEEKSVPDELPPVSSPDEIEVSNKSGELDTSSESPVHIKEKSDINEDTIKTEGFFSNILKQAKNKENRHKLLSGDLFSRMSTYWKLKKYETKTGTIISDEQKLEDELIRLLTQLQDLENKWAVQKKALEDDIRFLHEREKEIQLKGRDVRKIVDKLKQFEAVPYGKYLNLQNGVIIKNIRELISVLEILDEATFRRHVNNKKNDISDWIREVTGDKGFAGKLSKATTKEEIIKILETHPADLEEQNSNGLKIKPKDYLQIADGVVIRDLHELSDALKVMSDDVFSQHVTSKKNDFSDWVMNHFKNRQLAELLSKSKSKKGMISVLESFL